MSNVKLKVLVVGATGSIGSLVVKEGVRQGHKVRALVRSESKGRQLPSEAEAVVGDLICGRWWLIHRRAWNPHSRSNEDEAMRRHVNRNYD
jgi:nucleoside-diphosphate-sugar epimerase